MISKALFIIGILAILQNCKDWIDDLIEKIKNVT
jgi:hypothetical protein